MERNLEIKIKLNDTNNVPTVEIYEPESGDFHRSTVNPEVLQEKGLQAAVEEMFTKEVGDELYGWYIGLVEDLEFQQKQEENFIVLWVDEDNGDRDADGRVTGGYEAGYHTDYAGAVKQAEEDRGKICPQDREIVIVKADDFHKNSGKAPLNILWTNKKELQMAVERPTLDMMTDFKGEGFINLSKSEPLLVEPDHINACYELWFDVDKVFGTDTMKNDSTVEFYTNYYPESGKFECEVVVETDGTTTYPEYKMTDKEMTFLKNMMEEEARKQGFASLDDMFILENELEEKEQ